MKLSADHQLHAAAYQFVAGARHRAAFAWCGATTSSTESICSTMPNTKHQRLKEPSPG